jgi:hypothetical protein
MTISFRNCQRKAKEKEEADPCGMTARKAKAKAIAPDKAGRTAGGLGGG